MRKFSKKEILNLKLFSMPIEKKDILEKDPQAKGKDIFTSENKFFVGIWEANISKFNYTYEEDEACYILKGKAIVKKKNKKIELNPGDLVFFKKGESVVWQILSKLRKIYFIYEK